MRVQKGWPCDDIECWLFESLTGKDNVATYNALSYTWGRDQTGVKDLGIKSFVFVNGKRFDISENLYSAIRQIRQDDRDITLWVDAICINQRDPVEKGYQVQQMGDIYAKAEEVLIWLGASNEDITSLFILINWVDWKATEAQANGSYENWLSLCGRYMSEWPRRDDSELLATQTRGLAELLQRPWFKRVWILQEVTKARSARVMSGSLSCPARTFALMPSLMGLDVDQHTQAVLDIMPRLRTTTWWLSNRRLHTLLTKFADSQASQGRDKVYALLGMSEDACDPKIFYPCYRISNDEVIRDTLSFLLFKKILDSSYLFPVLNIAELSLPIIQLVGKTLEWTLSEPWVQGQESGGTTLLLVDLMSEGQLNIWELLESLKKSHNATYRFRFTWTRSDAPITVAFGDTQNILRIILTTMPAIEVSLHFKIREYPRPRERDVFIPRMYHWPEEREYEPMGYLFIFGLGISAVTGALIAALRINARSG